MLVKPSSRYSVMGTTRKGGTCEQRRAREGIRKRSEGGRGREMLVLPPFILPQQSLREPADACIAPREPAGKGVEELRRVGKEGELRLELSSTSLRLADSHRQTDQFNFLTSFPLFLLHLSYF